MICGSAGSKSRLAKAAGAEPSGEMRDEQLHAVVVRSTFPSQNVQNTPRSDHFWKLRCRKRARAVVARSTFPSQKCKKLRGFGPLLDDQMSKKCTPFFTCPSQNVQNTPLSDHFWNLKCRKRARALWREAHFQIKSQKNLGVRTAFGRSDVVLRGKRKGLSTLSQVGKTWRFCSSFSRNHQHSTLHYTALHYTTLHYTTPTALHYTTRHHTSRHYIQLHYTTLHYTTLHSTTPHPTTHTTLHHTTPHRTQLHYTTLPYTILHYTTLHSITFHYTTLHYTTLNYITLHYIALHHTALHYTTLHPTTLHCTALNYTRLLSTTLHYTRLLSTTLHYDHHYKDNYNYITTTLQQP